MAELPDYIAYRDGVVDLLIQGNFPDLLVKPRNRPFVRPTSNNPAAPAVFAYYDAEDDSAEVITNGGTQAVDGFIFGTVFQAGGTGDSAINAVLDQLNRVSLAWRRLGAGGGKFLFGAVRRSGLEYEGDAEAPMWAYRKWELAFKFIGSSTLTDEEVGILGGLSSSTMQVAGPGLLTLDWIGQDSSSDPAVYRRVKAADDEPAPLGLVSAALDGGQVLVVLVGFVRIAGGHGWPVGPLYLSQDTEGAATSDPPPDSGQVIKLAQVLNSTDLVVRIEQGADL
jgi:hypothetical protein